jgi:hypothetical protein
LTPFSCQPKNGRRKKELQSAIILAKQQGSNGVSFVKRKTSVHLSICPSSNRSNSHQIQINETRQATRQDDKAGEVPISTKVPLPRPHILSGGRCGVDFNL